MTIRVPLLLEVVEAVILRLDLPATQAFDPPGEGTAGYDPLLKEPTVYTGADGKRYTSRHDMPTLRVPCQVEVLTHEKLREYFAGNSPSSNVVLVLSRIDLEAKGLLDASTGRPRFKVNDRVERLEKAGRVVHTLPAGGLFIFEVRPASWGFGPDGHDLELLFLNDRQRAA